MLIFPNVVALPHTHIGLTALAEGFGGQPMAGPIPNRRTHARILPSPPCYAGMAWRKESGTKATTVYGARRSGEGASRSAEGSVAARRDMAAV
jgi:hypothetical protein